MLLLVEGQDGVLLTDRTWLPLWRVLKRDFPAGITVWTAATEAEAKAERRRWRLQPVQVVRVERPFLWPEA